MRIPIFLHPDDDDDFTSAFESIKNNTVVDEETVKLWKQQHNPKLPVLDYIELGYLGNIGYRALLYSPLQEGTRLTYLHGPLQQYVLEYIQANYAKNPKQFIDVNTRKRKNYQYPDIIPFAAAEEVFPYLEQNQHELWMAKRMHAHITQELTDQLPASTRSKLKM